MPVHCQPSLELRQKFPPSVSFPVPVKARGRASCAKQKGLVGEARRQEQDVRWDRDVGDAAERAKPRRCTVTNF